MFWVTSVAAGSLRPHILWGLNLFLSLPGSSAHGILQARILEWAAMLSSRGSSWPWNQTCVSCVLHWQTGSLPLAPPREPCNIFAFPLKPEGNQFPGLTHYLRAASILSLCLFPGGFCRLLPPATSAWTFEVKSRPVLLSLVSASGYSVIRYPKF